MLSQAVRVARQTIVADVALLRSSGVPIISYARGYELVETLDASGPPDGL